ncbi:MAG: flagellar basal body L-ring protein FlgH [Alphaproteobacteria bacterium]|nr:MAG: flagellar basal body L-ring protein FlgH [Alphaproteobacteria bacterium]
MALLLNPTALAVVLAGLMLAGCGAAQRIANIGRAPDMSPMSEVQAPVLERSLASQGGYSRRPALPGLTAAQTDEQPDNASLWRTGAKAFFRDQRAAVVGDILTVKINISDRAQVGNTTTRTRSSSEGAGLDNFLGLESKLDSFLPSAVSPGDLVKADSASTTTGNGAVQRSETIELTLAAVVTQVLPNGNLVIQGRQEVRVNFEVRELIIAGIVRPQDITTDNTIQHTQIAEARISYGGRGQLTDVQQARYGQQLYDILFPF